MTPEQLVEEIVRQNNAKPFSQRATRREILDALLTCVAGAVAERDAQEQAGEDAQPLPVLEMPREAIEQMEALIANPPPPSERLMEAGRRYREFVKKRRGPSGEPR